MYKVSILYTSKVQAQFRLAVGSYRDIQNGKAPALQARLPESVSAYTGITVICTSVWLEPHARALQQTLIVVAVCCQCLAQHAWVTMHTLNQHHVLASLTIR
jgi:hypothetical protein